MPKPWARYEVGFINHDKFLAISGNAICLWIEGKNYADQNLTDGLLPLYAVKQFRFYSQKNVGILTASVGVQPGTERAYAPLWEPHAVGFKMHDYLEHNDCREKVLKRIWHSDSARKADAERLRQWRDAKKRKRETVSETPRETPGETVSETLIETPNVTRETPVKRSIQNTEYRSAAVKEQQQQSSGGSKRPFYQSDRFVVFEWQLDELGRILGPHLNDFDLHAFFDDLSRRSREHGLVIPGDREARWKWLQVQVDVEARRRGLPMADGAVVEQYECPHRPPCVNGPNWQCRQRTALERVKVVG